MNDRKNLKTGMKRAAAGMLFAALSLTVTSCRSPVSWLTSVLEGGRSHPTGSKEDYHKAEMQGASDAEKEIRTLFEEKKHADALELLEKKKAEWPGYKGFDTLREEILTEYEEVCIKRVNEIAAAGDYESALGVLNRFSEEHDRESDRIREKREELLKRQAERK